MNKCKNKMYTNTDCILYMSMLMAVNINCDLMANPNMTLEVVMPNETESEGKSLQEEWVDEAILEVAYYLRAFKFNYYDIRYHTANNNEKAFYKSFPNPPLRSLHWEVHKNCEPGFLECLKYLLMKISETPIKRSVDPIYRIYEKGLTLADNATEIALSEEECQRRLKLEDNEVQDIFGGYLERFQWKTTAAYYMCYFTLQDNPDLSLFGEPCDNFANCVARENGNSDPRADDSKPYYCALYSFCPDICCPLRQIKDVSECTASNENPCKLENSLDNQQCEFNKYKNADFYSIVRNRWNVTCHCTEQGFNWDSRFGMCVDIDECLENSDGCDEQSETCLNLRGSYACACAVGYRWNVTAKKCTPIVAFHEIENISMMLLLSEEAIPERKENLQTSLKGVYYFAKDLYKRKFSKKKGGDEEEEE